MFVVARPAGRLLAIRVEALADTVAVTRFRDAIVARLKELPYKEQGIICADHRQVKIYHPDVSEALAKMFFGLNPRLLRAGIVIAESNATFWLQMQRVVKEASLEQRQAFRDAQACATWLEEVLTQEERLAARQHLGLP